MTGSITALFLTQLWQEYSRNPSFGGLHGEERDHAVADVVVVEGLLHPLPPLHHRRRLAHLAGDEELAPEMRLEKLNFCIWLHLSSHLFNEVPDRI